MEESIRNFAKQFEYEPQIENADKWPVSPSASRDGQAVRKFILCGMGGSHLQGDVFQNAYPGFDLSIHQDYGIPGWPEEVLKNTLILASSYSGNTEEALSSLEQAMQYEYPVAVLSTGGKLIELAKKHGVPYIQIPDTGIQPRSALGFTFKALAKMVGREDIVQEATEVGKQLEEHAENFEKAGKQMAEWLQGGVPIIYASNKNYSIAYNWKIKFNETGKIPAFYNVFPELNHNEMNGFDVSDSTRELAEKFHFIFLKDMQDHPRIQKRMEILQHQLIERKFKVNVLALAGDSELAKIFSSLVIADWTALHTAKAYNRDPEQVPMIEEFKKSLG